MRVADDTWCIILLGQFYIYFGDPDRGIFMVRTSDPAGVWDAPVWVVKAKGLIDPCPLWDEDGDGVGEPVMKHRKPELRSSGVFQPAESDRFDNLELGLQWQGLDWVSRQRI